MATTKFSVPSLPRHYLPRPSLFAALDAGSDHPLTVVIGVPGAGKSVLLAAWVRQRAEPTDVWLSCDDRDGDPVTFWFALANALRRAWPDHWLDVFDLLAEDDPNLNDVAVAVVNELAALGEPVVMIIDDLQHAGAAGPSLSILIERLPDSARIVLGSRSEPRLPLHRLRAHGRLLEVRDADLRLSPDEVSGLVTEFGLRLDDREIDVLEQRTEGWVAGVQMAALSLRGARDPDRFLSDLAKTQRSTADFLSAEVLDRQPPEVRDFLFATAILDEFDAGACSAVTERSDARVMLDRVEDLNLFLIPLGDGVFRYHELFRDLVRYRVRAEDPERELQLHRRAAAHFERRGDLEWAFHHLVAAHDTDEAFRLLHDSVVTIFLREDGRLLHRIITSIDSGAVAAEPERMVDLAVTFALNGQLEAADLWIGRADAHRGTLDREASARLEYTRGFIAGLRGDAAESEAALQHAVEFGADLDDDFVATAPTVFIRTRLWLGDAAGARQAFAVPIDPTAPATLKLVLMTAALAWTACVEGALREADDLADRALAHAIEYGLDGHPSTSDALRTRGRVAFERGQLDAAEGPLDRSLAISEDSRPAFALLSQLTLSRLWLAEGRIDEAITGVVQARSFLPPTSTSPLLAHCVALDGRIALETGDLARAEQLVPALDHGHRHAVLQARISLARRNPEQAAEAIGQLKPQTVREQLDVAVLGARLGHLEGRDDADSALSDVLELAGTEGFVTVVTDDMAELSARTAALLRSRPIGWFAQSVLDRLERSLPMSVTNEARRSSVLSDRELLVLRYLGSRLTNPEIAAELFISVNTLKTHVKAIYRKLGVSSRREALSEARRLALT